MERGYYRQWRKEEDSAVWHKPPIYGRLWQWIKMNADYETGILKPQSMATIAQRISWQEDGHEAIPKRNHVHVMIKWMQSEGMITYIPSEVVQGKIQEKIHKAMEISIVNWDRYSGIKNGENTREDTGKIHFPDQYKGYSIERSTSSNEEVSVTATPTPRRVRKEKVPADPITNPTPVLELIYSDNTIMACWARDGKIIKELLKREKALGEADPHEVVYRRWQMFRNGAADSDIRTRGRSKDVLLFSLVYQLLIEKSVVALPKYRFHIRDMNQRPISEPWRRWKEIKDGFPQAKTDPDFDYEFRLTDEQVQATTNPFKQPMPKGVEDVKP